MNQIQRTSPIQGQFITPYFDILPVLELGGQAVYIPYATTWAHEHADPPEPGTPGFHTIEHLGQLPDFLAKLNREKQKG